MITGVIKELSLLLVLVLVTGCATSMEESKPRSIPSSDYKEEKDPFADFFAQYRFRAREIEKQGNLPKALEAWKIVHSFIPADEEAGKKITQLKNQISAAADQRFRKGLGLFQSHSYVLARKEFLLAIYLKPDHEEAIRYLKQKMPGEDAFLYEVQKGDTLKEVARKFYGDEQKDFLIAYFNGLRAGAQIEPPMVLRMPIMDSPSAKRSTSPKMAEAVNSEIPRDFQEILGKARNAYRLENYRESAAFSEKIVEYDPQNYEGHELLNASYYQLGKQLAGEKKLDEAREAFRRVAPGYKDVNLQLAQNQKQLAEAHYIKGVKFFIDEKIETAIQEWETTLALEPKHPKAKKDIENARLLLQKLEKVK